MKTIAAAKRRIWTCIDAQGDKFEQMGRNDGFRKSGSKADQVGCTLAKRTALNDIAFSAEVSEYMKLRYIAGYEAGKEERYKKRGQPREN